MTIGIYTIHSAYNYGAMLQAYATLRIIREEGYEAEIVNDGIDKVSLNHYVKKVDSLRTLVLDIWAVINPRIWKKSKLFREFHESLVLSKRYPSLDNLYSNPPTYDVHLVGSDQTWNLERGIDGRKYFFLDFLKGDEKRISYGPSFGNVDIPESYFPRLKELLSKFSYISTREDVGVDLISSATGLHATQVLDPTFLLSGRQWSELCGEKALVEGDYIVYYGFDKSESCNQIVREVRNSLRIPVVAVSCSTTILHTKVDKFIQAAGPREFLNLFYNAAYVITGSFHGLAFALNFRKNFVALKFGVRMCRLESILGCLGLGHRIVANAMESRSLMEKEPYVDYSVASKILDTERDKSISWLRNALESLK